MRDRGAHFHRYDFQAHTSHDAQWEGARPPNDVERHTYALDFVVACRSQGLGAVAITDHHYPSLARCMPIQARSSNPRLKAVRLSGRAHASHHNRHRGDGDDPGIILRWARM